MQPHYLTAEEAAVILRVHPETVKRWLRAKLLVGKKVGGRLWRIPANEVVAKGSEK
jgi:excisionase family DNA binding protein